MRCTSSEIFIHISPSDFDCLGAHQPPLAFFSDVLGYVDRESAGALFLALTSMQLSIVIST